MSSPAALEQQFRRLGLPLDWQVQNPESRGVFQAAEARFQEGVGQDLSEETEAGVHVRARTYSLSGEDIQPDQLDITDVTAPGRLTRVFEITKTYGDEMPSLAAYASAIFVRAETFQVKRQPRLKAYSFGRIGVMAEVVPIEDCGDLSTPIHLRYSGRQLQREHGIEVHREQPGVIKVVDPQKARRMRRDLALVTRPTTQILEGDLRFSTAIKPDAEPLAHLSGGVELLKAA
jgi:hypothetical protein